MTHAQAPALVRSAAWAAMLAIASAMWTVRRQTTRLACAQARAQAVERARCARLLHDHPMQILEVLNAGDHIKDPVVRAYLADETAWLRRLIELSLDPPENDGQELELVRTLAGVVDRFRPRGLRGRLVARPEVPVPLPGPVVEAFENAVTEALTNVLKHAGPARATVVVRSGPTDVVVTVADRGPGFRPEHQGAGRFGVRRSMAGWMESVGGTGEVRSAVGRGTEVRLRYALTGRPPGP